MSTQWQKYSLIIVNHRHSNANSVCCFYDTCPTYILDYICIFAKTIRCVAAIRELKCVYLVCDLYEINVQTDGINYDFTWLICKELNVFSLMWYITHILM